MALVDLCRLNEKINLRPVDSLASFQNDVLGYSQNFINSAQLATPPFANPVETLAQFNTQDETGKKIKIEFDHGTTTLGFRYKPLNVPTAGAQAFPRDGIGRLGHDPPRRPSADWRGGVLLAVDSRATGGQFIGSQSMKKIVEINDYLLADCVYWDRVLAKQCRLYELRNRERISVAAASKLMANMVYNYKGMGLSMGMMLAGYDKRGAQLYYVDSEGTRTPGKVFSVGSGSVYAFGVLDSGYKWDLSDEEAQELGRRAIYHATHRDAYSGGIIRVYHMSDKGWVNISNEDCSELHYKYQAEKGVKEE
ncbi:unnamed protein product [Chilo suppressalis]|uniref:proteasome endopeptidase complex n=1 Tax=Chilo suppressalis TaxID=168631 RepID=A0ABN8B7H6_CHISP|nr:unnamed protein product [Chilo suppressalis]